MTFTDERRDIVLQLKDLRYDYATHQAVRGVDLVMNRGEVFALLGTNGAGKTTTLEIIEGHRRPTRGHVRVLGVDPQRDRRRLSSRAGVMFQEPSTPDELTPAQTLTLWTQLIGGARPTRASVDEQLARVDLLHRRDVAVSKLSGGERRRLDLAVALTGDPELLLLDEPTTGLDPESRSRTWETIRAAVTAGASVLLTTHYLEEAEVLADRLAILHEGQVAVAGTLDDVRANQPAHIEFRLPAPPARERSGDRRGWPWTHRGQPPSLRGTPRVMAEGDRRRISITTDDLQQDLTSLLTWAAANSIDLENLHASESSLAQVFHAIVDRPAQNGGDQ